MAHLTTFNLPTTTNNQQPQALPQPTTTIKIQQPPQQPTTTIKNQQQQQQQQQQPPQPQNKGTCRQKNTFEDGTIKNLPDVCFFDCHLPQRPVAAWRILQLRSRHAAGFCCHWFLGVYYQYPMGIQIYLGLRSLKTSRILEDQKQTFNFVSICCKLCCVFQTAWNFPYK